MRTRNGLTTVQFNIITFAVVFFFIAPSTYSVRMMKAVAIHKPFSWFVDFRTDYATDKPIPLTSDTVPELNRATNCVRKNRTSNLMAFTPQRITPSTRIAHMTYDVTHNVYCKNEHIKMPSIAYIIITMEVIKADFFFFKHARPSSRVRFFTNYWKTVLPRPNPMNARFLDKHSLPMLYNLFFVRIVPEVIESNKSTKCSFPVHISAYILVHLAFAEVY